MILRLLKNDIIHGRLANTVMMIFIAISAMLSCASVSLLYASTNQIDYFMNDMGNSADLNFSMMNVTKQDQENILSFLAEKGIQDFQIEDYVNLATDTLSFENKEDVNCTGCFATTLPKKYNFLFDEENNIPDIQKGYVGVPLSMKKSLDLSIGDTLTITRKNSSESFIIQAFIRDSLYGSDMMGQKRVVFHPEDYDIQYQVTDNSEHAYVLSIKSNENQQSLEYAMQQAGLPNYLLVTKDTAYLSFLGVGIGISAMMMMSGIILLCISFLIIRYTILFQIESKYAEIGMLKAIGLTHRQVKTLYMSKYIGIGILGSIIGFLCSVPFAQGLKEMQSGVVPIMLGNTGTYLSMLVVIVMLCMIYNVTTLVLHRLKKQSAMDAIRKGNEGESFQNITKFELSNRKKLSVQSYLACNDVIAHKRNTMMMILIYALCLLLMLIPLTLKDAFADTAFLQILKITEGDIYTQQNGGTTLAKLEEDQMRVSSYLQSLDPNVQVRIETMSSVSVSDQGVNTSGFLIKRADENEGVLFDIGSKPILENEIGLSSTLAKTYNKTTGDTISIIIEGVEQEFIITGIYSSMMNLGNNLLANPMLPLTFVNTSYLVANFSEDHSTNQKLSQQAIDEYKEINLITGNDMMKSLSGDMANQIGILSDIMFIILLSIVFALTILFSKLQIIKAKKASTLLQSLGYCKKDIRIWQMRRCMIQVLLSALLGMILHALFTTRFLEAFFQAMGMGKIHLEHDVIHAFIIYPFAFIVCVIIAQWLVNFTIHTWDVKELSEE